MLAKCGTRGSSARLRQTKVLECKIECRRLTDINFADMCPPGLGERLQSVHSRVARLQIVLGQLTKPGGEQETSGVLTLEEVQGDMEGRMAAFAASLDSRMRIP